MMDVRMKRSLVGESGLRITEGAVHSYPIHTHSYYEMLLYPVFDGQVTVNDTTVVASVPFAVLMTPADLHRIEARTPSDATSVKIAFTDEMLDGAVAGRLKSALVAFCPDVPGVTELFRHLTRPRPIAEQAVLLRALVLLLAENGREIPSPPASAGERTVARAVAIIGDEFHTDLTLSSLAKRLNVSYHHLCASFGEQLGVSFSSYLADVRLRHAAIMLQNEDRRITEIALDCGYRNLSHFLRSFKKKFEKTPKEYRKASQAAKAELPWPLKKQ